MGNIELVKWEMEKLLRNKVELQSVGRDLDYIDIDRLKKLRAIMDEEISSNVEIKPTPVDDVSF